MRRLRRAAGVALFTVSFAAAGLAAVPAQAGLPEAEPSGPPAAYIVDGVDFPDACALQRLDLATGEVTALSAAPSQDACVIDLAVAPDGSVWGIGPATTELINPAFLVEFDPATGAVLSNTPITGAFSGASIRFGGLAFDGAGTLYAQLTTDEPGCDGTFVCLYTLDRSTAEATFVGAPGADFAITFLTYLGADCGTALQTTVPAFIAETDTAWGEATPASHDDRDSLASYDKASGVLTEVAHFASEDEIVVGLDYARADGALYALIAPLPIPGETEATEEAGGESTTTEATTEPAAAPTAAGDVYASAFDVGLYRVDPATAAVTLVAPLSQPEANLAVLGIAGTCPVAPIVLEPTFTG